MRFLKALKKRRGHPEDDLQMVVCEYLDRFCPVLYWAVPNGGMRAIREAVRFKKMGVKPGVYDLHFLLTGGQLGIIELKVRPNKPSPDQLVWGSRAAEGGAKTAVAYSFNEVISALRSWGVTLPAATTSLEERVTLARRVA